MDDGILRLFADLSLQGPGSDGDTVAALESIRSRIPATAAIADFGCGTGRSSFVLLHELPAASVRAIDAVPLFIERLADEARRRRIDDRLQPMVEDMLAPPIEPGTIDLIWSEGAAHAVGFEAALRAWKPLLRDDGLCVLSECEWLSDDRPPEVARFWRENYPCMGDRAGNIGRARAAGYDVLATHVLSEAGWTRYHAALAQAVAAADQGSLPPGFADAIAREIEVRRTGASSFGYVFYVLQVLCAPGR